MDVRVFKGKLGHEEGIGTITEPMLNYFDFALPTKGDLIGLDDEVYEILQVLMDYTNDADSGHKPEYSIFVKVYDWE